MTTFFNDKNDLQIVKDEQDLLDQIKLQMGHEYAKIAEGYMGNEEIKRLNREINELEQEVEMLNEEYHVDAKIMCDKITDLINDIIVKELDMNQVILTLKNIRSSI